LVVLSLSAAKKKPQKEETTQTLALPVDPPPVATGETRRLVFQNVPLAGKGLSALLLRAAVTCEGCRSW
jgi:hypothetical protein